ncbi:TPA: hypothetical protein N3G98_004407 [Salmonella enterica subsp. enterica serovar Denver]|nr:hypothetical protein [Salmonella enterica subsp. enterica serovar Denver]
MNRKGFTPDDIETIASPTASDSVWAAAADRAEQQLAQELPPPATPCFTQAEVDEFLARKPQKYQMTEKDFQELGRNMVLGVGDLIMGTAQVVAIVNEVIPENNEPTSGWGYDAYGCYGYYGSHNWGINFDK